MAAARAASCGAAAEIAQSRRHLVRRHSPGRIASLIGTTIEFSDLCIYASYTGASLTFKLASILGASLAPYAAAIAPMAAPMLLVRKRTAGLLQNTTRAPISGARIGPLHFV